MNDILKTMFLDNPFIPEQIYTFCRQLPRPKGPLRKGGWHGEAVTGGFLQKQQTHFDRGKPSTTAFGGGPPPLAKGGLPAGDGG